MFSTGKGQQKSRTFLYFLPNADCRKVQMCREMFLNTLNLSDRQIRTTVEKLSSHGSLQKEGRGGRRPKLKEKDERLQQNVTGHIGNFHQ